MPTFVALLRGINVGKAKRLPMADLRAVLADLGYTRVATLLNSGNAVFAAASGTAARHATSIAAMLRSRLGFDVPVLVKSAKDLSAIVAENPIADGATQPSRLLVVFTQGTQGLAALGAVSSLVVPPERFVLGKHAAYLWCAHGILESAAGAALLAKSGTGVTTRNWATTLKLQAMADGGEG